MKPARHDGKRPADKPAPRTAGTDRRPYRPLPRPAPIPAKTLGIASFEVPAAHKDASRLVSSLLDIVEEVAPIPGGRRKDLRRDVLELWRELTSERSARQPDYMGEPSRLAAYLRYFLPWNVVRLAAIFSDLDLGLGAESSVLDIGSGPLTLPIALWIARPELRELPLRVVCSDRVRRAMETGLALLEGLALRAGHPLAWKVELRRESFSLTEAKGDERFSLVAAANVFNESFWRVKGSLSERADALAMALGARAARGGRVLVVEPGDPRSGAMLAALRESVILGGGWPLAPCPHAAACPMAGAFLSSAFRKDDDDEAATGKETAENLGKVVTARGRSKAPWCHFVIDHGAAPARLVDFSEAAGLPKDRLIASWLLLQPDPPAGAARPQRADRALRLVSDAFRLPDGGLGRYACMRSGYALARGSLADLPSGALAVLDAALPGAEGERDPKSNAIVVKATSPDIPALPPPRASTRPHADAPRKGGDSQKGGALHGDGPRADHPRADRPHGDEDRSRGRSDRDDRERDSRSQGARRDGKPRISPRHGRQRERDSNQGSDGKPTGRNTLGVTGLGERSPYARKKKPWGPHKPKRSP